MTKRPELKGLSRSEYLKEYNRCYRREHDDETKAAAKEWSRNNRARIRGSVNRRLKELKIEAMVHLGGALCARCGFSDLRALQIDHVNGGGKAERKKNRNYPSYYRSVAKSEIGKYQVLCANCNWSKRSENGEEGTYRSKDRN